MNKRLMNVIGSVGCAVALCLGLAACGGTAAGNASERSVTVTARSKVSVVPDRCDFNVTITKSGTGASEAQRAASKPVSRVIKRLKELGVPAESIQTVYTDISPVWDDEGPTDEYEARVMLHVSDVSVDQVGELMQAATEEGATEVDGVEYASTAYEDSYQEALAKAVADARPKAEAIAQASGTTLGEVLSVSEGYQDMSLYTEESVALASADGVALDKGIELAPGEVDIEAEVTVTYALN